MSRTVADAMPFSANTRVAIASSSLRRDSPLPELRLFVEGTSVSVLIVVGTLMA